MFLKKKDISAVYRDVVEPSLTNFVTPKNIIALLILYCPFTIGEWVPGNYILFTLFFNFILFLLLARIIFNHKRILKTNYTIPIIIFALSFYISLYMGLPYKQMNDFTDYDSSIQGVFFVMSQFIPMQLFLIFFIYLSIESIEDIVFHIKIFLLSGILVNGMGILVVLFGFLPEDATRLSLSFGDSNYLGRFEVLMIAITLCFILFLKISLAKKIFGIIFILFCFIFLIASISRAALVSLGLILVIIFLFSRFKVIKYVAIATNVLIVVYFLLIVGSQKVANVAVDTGISGSFVDLSNATRIALIVAAVNMFLDFPLFGIGFYNFYNIYINYNYMPIDLPLGVKITVVHSWFFSTLAEQGLLGIISLLWILFLLSKDLLKFTFNTVDKERFIGITLVSMNFILLFNGFVNPIFYPELLFSLIAGLTGGYFKICSINSNQVYKIE